MVLFAGTGHAIELITSKEAALPLDRSANRGITRGPAVQVLYPPPSGGVIGSPFSLKVRFESRGASRIDLDSVVVTYRRIPAVDLTQRIRAFIRADGIDVPDAQVPAGEHRIWVVLRDIDGRTGFADFTFTVTK
jgi:hypothetical protein